MGNPPQPTTLETWLSFHSVVRIKAGTDAIKVLTAHFNHLDRTLGIVEQPLGQIRVELDKLIAPQNVVLIAQDGCTALLDLWVH